MEGVEEIDKDFVCDMQKMIPILLTATVNPQGMKGANFDVSERIEMYAEALKFYASKGLSVVFAENSGFLKQNSQIISTQRSKGTKKNTEFSYDTSLFENVEFVDVSGPEYDQSRGKGYNEAILLHKAVMKSKKIQEAGCFFKVTGRLKVLNIETLLREVSGLSAKLIFEKSKFQVSGFRFLADCKDHKVYEWLHMPINGHAGECRYWYASVEFFESMMWPRYDELNDYPPHMYLAEDLMLDVCRKTRGMAGCRDRFRTQARISGRGGHNLGKGWSFFYSTDNDSLALKIKCGLRQVLRWVMPWWKV